MKVYINFLTKNIANTKIRLSLILEMFNFNYLGSIIIDDVEICYRNLKADIERCLLEVKQSIKKENVVRNKQYGNSM